MLFLFFPERDNDKARALNYQKRKLEAERGYLRRIRSGKHYKFLNEHGGVQGILELARMIEGEFRVQD